MDPNNDIFSNMPKFEVLFFLVVDRTFRVGSFATINDLRLDPIGGAASNNNSQTDGNTFHVDYIRLNDFAIAVPEPSSVAILGFAFSSLLMRRKRLQG
jgi:hypothetical protein